MTMSMRILSWEHLKVEISPLLANIMLNELDKEMEKRGLNFVRYADDCIIMVGSEIANRVMRNISRFIEGKTRT